MIAWLPVGAVGEWLGAGAGLFAVPLAVAIGIPIYLNSFAAIPFVSGLIGLGMSPGNGARLHAGDERDRVSRDGSRVGVS
jgi:uncharacterized membrane protein YraQ (UPF0718 family)